MHQFRPRFALPSFGQRGPETPQNSGFEDPVDTFSLRPLGRFALCLAAGAIALSACSADDGETAAANETEQSGEQAETPYEDGKDAAEGSEGASELNFGDPAEVGFDEVQDTEQDPVETPAAEQEALSAPEEVIEEVSQQLESAPEGGEILDAVGQVDGNEDVATDRDGRSRNSSGELAILDEAANLACAHVEIALSLIDEGNGSIAIERIWSAADQAGKSGIGAVQDWQQPLADVIAEGAVSDVAPLVGFITVCAEGGYEL